MGGPHSATKEQLDTAITTIWDDLEDINKTCLPPFLQKTKYVPWWSPKLNALRKQVNALKRRVKRCKNPVLREICSTRFKEFKNRYKAKSSRPSRTPGRNFVQKTSEAHLGKCTKCVKLASQVNQPPPR
jgi:hypothetical protein